MSVESARIEPRLVFQGQVNEEMRTQSSNEDSQPLREGKD